MKTTFAGFETDLSIDAPILDRTWREGVKVNGCIDRRDDQRILSIHLSELDPQKHRTLIRIPDCCLINIELTNFFLKNKNALDALLDFSVVMISTQQEAPPRIFRGSHLGTIQSLDAFLGFHKGFVGDDPFAICSNTLSP
jgi:hypothetical protein